MARSYNLLSVQLIQEGKMETIGRVTAWTPAQVAALVFGIWWIGNALAVFFVAADAPGGFGAATAVDAGGLSIAVNGWHGVFHLVTGLAGLAACPWQRSSRAYALAMAILYLSAALSAALIGPTVFGLIRVDLPGSIDHAVEGSLFAWVWFVSRDRPGP
jgi:Domain of unknown function (DUF4383)